MQRGGVARSKESVQSTLSSFPCVRRPDGVSASKEPLQSLLSLEITGFFGQSCSDGVVSETPAAHYPGCPVIGSP